MNGDHPSSSSRDSLQGQPDLSSHSPLIPETCFTQAETSRFHPQKPNYIAPTQYSTQVPLMVQISPGIWSDGQRKVISAHHPDVIAFIADARRNLKLPVPPSEIVFVLAALDVFYKPGDPVHWLFWSDDKKYVTAEVVTRISLHQPALIRSNVAWNGTPEYLSILANHHCSTWRQLFESKDWYPILVPPKSGPPKVLNLRKRKVAPGAMREPSKSPSLDDELEEEPTPKRSRNVSAKAVQKQAVNNDNFPHPNMADILPRTAASPPILNDAMPLDELTSSDTPCSVENSLPQDNPDEKGASSQPRSSGRQHRRRKRTAAPAIIRSSDGDGSSRSSSKSPVDVTPAASSTSEPSVSTSSTIVHSRTRSTSHVSAETLIGSSQGRRSSSVLSTCTAVDGGSASQNKGKDKEGDSCEFENKSEADTTTNEADDDEFVGVVTRGRARGKTTEKSSVPIVSRSKPAAPATVSRKRMKKSRS